MLGSAACNKRRCKKRHDAATYGPRHERRRSFFREASSEQSSLKMVMATEFEIALEGPSGEPVDFVRTILSHGIADLPPAHIDEEARTFTTTLVLPSGQPRTILITDGGQGF